MTKHTFLIVSVLFSLLFSLVAYSYILPDYQICEKDSQLSAEEALARHESELANLGQKVNILRLAAHKRDRKIKLSQKERKLAAIHEHYTNAIGFWRQTIDLKTSLLLLVGEKNRKAAESEADAMARSIISSLYRVSREWRVGGSSLLRNFLINIGVRQKGFCYHYVREILKDIPKKDWHYFDIHWGTAWKGSFRENNALVITAKNADFASGIAIDAWRAKGRPFWILIKEDRFPWKKDIITNNDT